MVTDTPLTAEAFAVYVVFVLAPMMAIALLLYAYYYDNEEKEE